MSTRITMVNKRTGEEEPYDDATAETVFVRLARAAPQSVARLLEEAGVERDPSSTGYRLVERARPQVVPVPSGSTSVSGYVLDREGWQLSSGCLPDGHANMHSTYPPNEGEPHAEVTRGRCPRCREPVVSNMYWHAAHGFLIRYECWGALKNRYVEGECQWYSVP